MKNFEQKLNNLIEDYNIPNLKSIVERYMALVRHNTLKGIETDITFNEYYNDMAQIKKLDGRNINYKVKDDELGFTKDNIKRPFAWKKLKQTELEELKDEHLTNEIQSLLFEKMTSVGEIEKD